MADNIIPIDVADALARWQETGDASALQSLINSLVESANAAGGGTGSGTIAVDSSSGAVVDMESGDVLFYTHPRLHIRFSVNQAGGGFVDDPADLSGDPTTIYVGLANSASTTAPTSSASYQWTGYTWSSNHAAYYSVVGGRKFEFATATSMPGAPFRPFSVISEGIDLDTLTTDVSIGSSPDTGAPSATDIGFTANEDLVAIADRGGGFFYTYGLAAADASDNPYSFAQFQTDNFSVISPGDRTVGNDAVEDGFDLQVGYEVDHDDSDPAVLEVYRRVTPPTGQAASLLDRGWTFNYHTGVFKAEANSQVQADYFPTYANSTAYVVGQMLFHSNVIYRVNTAIPATNTSPPGTNTSFTAISGTSTGTGDAVIVGNNVTGFGNRVLVTPLPLVAYTWNVSASPSGQLLNWDSLPTNITWTAVNDTNYQTEYATQVTGVTQGSTALTISDPAISSFAATTTFTLSQNSAAGTNQFDGRDTRTGSVTSQGGNTTLTATWRTNVSGRTTTSAASYQWLAVPNMNVTVDIGTQNFDAVDTNYNVTVSYSNLSSNGTVGSHTVTPNTGLGSAQTQASPGRSRTYSFTGQTIYHDTRVRGSVSGSLIRPSTVSAESLSNRTISRTGAWDRTPSTRYKTWAITSQTSADTFSISSDLGTLGNSGYATSATRIDSSITGWRNTTYNSGTAGAVPGTFFLVVPRQTLSTRFQNPSTNFFITPNATTNISLGHSGHQVNYTVYTFTIPAGGSLSMRITT